MQHRVEVRNAKIFRGVALKESHRSEHDDIQTILLAIANIYTKRLRWRRLKLPAGATNLLPSGPIGKRDKR